MNLEQNKQELLDQGIFELELEDLVEDLDLDIDYSINGFNDFEEHVNRLIDEYEVFYYRNAIEYLSDNDASLMESLHLASEFGFEPRDLNSEILATLLKQDNLRTCWNSISKEVKELFQEREDVKMNIDYANSLKDLEGLNSTLID